MSNLSLHSEEITAERGREFWRGVLLAGGLTALPRWTLNPVAGVDKHEVRIPDELTASLRRLANEVAVPLSSVLLTAHAKVLGALSGERGVCTGYALKHGSLLPLRMTLGPGSWREVLLDAARAEADLLAHSSFPVDDLRLELGLSDPPFETVFELAADGGGEFPEHTVLHVSFVEREGLVLRLRYKTDALDADYAARIVGYHCTALGLIAADPDAEHARQTLLSAEGSTFSCMASPDATENCQTVASTSSLRSERERTPTPLRPYAAPRSGRTENSMLTPINWRAPCWHVGSLAKASWAW